jgi:hypothetical protein
VSGHWTPTDLEYSINYRELLAVKLGLQSLLPEVKEVVSGWHPTRQRLSLIQVLSDNMTTVFYLRKLGGKVSPLNNLVREIHLLTLESLRASISAVHLPGIQNTTADHLSRLTPKPYEWRMPTEIYNRISQALGPHSIDAFGSYRTRQCRDYWSLHPDPFSLARDAFLQSWENTSRTRLWINPPWRSRLIHRILQKLVQDRTHATLITPDWPAQSWYAQLRGMSRESIPLSVQVAATDPFLLKQGVIPEPLENPKWSLRAWKIAPTARVRNPRR